MKWLLFGLSIVAACFASYFLASHNNLTLSATKPLTAGYYILSLDKDVDNCTHHSQPLKPSGYVIGPFTTIANTYKNVSRCQKKRFYSQLIYVPPSPWPTTALEKKA